MKTTFRVSRKYPKVLRNRKRRIERRLGTMARLIHLDLGRKQF